MQRHRHKAAPPTPNVRVVFEPIAGRPPPPERAHHYTSSTDHKNADHCEERPPENDDCEELPKQADHRKEGPKDAYGCEEPPCKNDKTARGRPGIILPGRLLA
eukprot:2224879-Alexandrium_andersonii.AAC.1